MEGEDMTKESAIARGPSLFALSLAVGLSATAGAQDAGDGSPQASPADGMEVILVTAQKRETALQDTPLAISAFAGAAMEDRGINDISSLEAYVPSLHVGREQDGFKISIRGIGLQGTSAISDSGVAFYQDGFYIPRPTGGSAMFFDVDRVEVLRGPQGTLYGRNATGGVINVIANEPTDAFEGRVGATYGERNLFEARGVLNVPLGDQLAARVGVLYAEDDGYVENVSGIAGTDDLFGRDGDLNLRGQLKFDSGAGTSVLVSVTYSDLNGSGVPLKYLERNAGGPPPTRALLGLLPPDFADPLTIATNRPGNHDTETLLLFARVEQEFEWFDVFVQGGILDQDSDLSQDVDGSTLDVSQFFKTQNNDASSVELRLSSKADAPFDWILGGYYFEEETFLNRLVALNGLSPMGIFPLPDFNLDEFGNSSTVAVFGSVTYPVTDTLSLTGGLRYTHDDRGGTKITISNFGQPLPPDLIDVSVSYDRVTWKAAAEWRPGENTLVYASVSNGYKAGGFNLTSSGQPYNPEEVLAFELGLKSNPLDGRAQFNLDAFYYDYKDLQLTNLTSVNNAPGQLTTNATATTIYGVELSGFYNITADLRLLAGYAYVDAAFDEYFNTDPRDPMPVFNPDDPLGFGRQNLEGNRVPYVSEHTISIGFDFTRNVGNDGRLTIAALMNWHSDMFLREYNDPVIDRVDANTKTDAHISYLFGSWDVEFTAFVTNIENNTEKTNIQISPGFVGRSAVTAYSRPRTWGVKLDWSF